MAAPQTSPDAVREALLEYETVCSKLRRVFREALPKVQDLQNEHAYFSSRLMWVMYTKAEGRLPEQSYHDLRLVLQCVESAEPVFTGLHKALEHKPVSASSELCAKAAGLVSDFTRCSTDIDGLLKRMADSRTATRARQEFRYSKWTFCGAVVLALFTCFYGLAPRTYLFASAGVGIIAFGIHVFFLEETERLAWLLWFYIFDFWPTDSVASHRKRTGF